MLADLIKIALLCVVIGGASIPASFTINDSPTVVWIGNALGSLFSAIVVICISNRITNQRFKNKASRWRVGKKIVKIYDSGEDSKKIQKANKLINKHGLRLFSFLCPVFPGVLISTIAVYVLDLDKRIYKRWMFTGIFFASGAYVYGYWWLFLK
jgi:hypothetical protein